MKNNLGELRDQKGWTQSDLAKRLGVSRQSVNAIETGKYDPSLPFAFRIAAEFESRIDEIFNPTSSDASPQLISVGFRSGGQLAEIEVSRRPHQVAVVASPKPCPAAFALRAFSSVERTKSKGMIGFETWIAASPCMMPHRPKAIANASPLRVEGRHASTASMRSTSPEPGWSLSADAGPLGRPMNRVRYTAGFD